MWRHWIIIMGWPLLLTLVGSGVYAVVAGDDEPTMATPADLEGVIAILDACPISDPAMRRYREDLLATASMSTQQEVFDQRPRMIVEAQKRCEAATRATTPPVEDRLSEPRTAQIPSPPDGAPSWYWLVAAGLTAMVLVYRGGRGGRK